MSAVRKPEGEVSFLNVASKAPKPEHVVEPAVCIGCRSNFYRQKPELAQLGEKYCTACRCKEQLRKTACRGMTQ